MTIKQFKKSILFTVCALALSPTEILAAQAVFTAETLTPPTPVLANTKTAVSAQLAKEKLMAKLAKINFFTADFNQETVDEEGGLVQKGAGNLAMSKPNLVHWQTLEPDETLIISNGKTLWFYDPFIEQVTLYQLEKAIANTPILLLTNESESIWQGYRVTQQSTNTFDVVSLSQESQIKTLTLHFDGDLLKQFSMLDATGQLSHFHLSHVNNQMEPDKSLFEFIVPQGTQVDDQR